MPFTKSTLVVLGFAILSNAHMIMNTPVPYGKSTLNNSPLDAAGADFPCKQRTGVYVAEGASNTMALGSSQPLSFTGSATHGGGSCQISITYDQAPTKSSVFKVIHSIEGGCPIKGNNGNNGDSANAVDPDTYNFTIPTTLPTGTATLAWTWFNKIGNREMYMNCAPVTLTAAASKRNEDEDLTARNITQLVERDTAAYDALPNMFVANIGNGCGTVDSTDLIFPNPGESLEQDGLATSSALSTPTGSACAAAISGASATAGGSGSTATYAASGVTSAASAASAASSTSVLSGGVFATVATSGSPAAATAATATSATPSSSASSGTTGTGNAIAAGSACTTEGEWNCIAGTSFQQCASGSWTAVQALAAGTTCTPGQSTAINITATIKTKVKRAIRFSSEHIGRHLQNSF